MAYSELIKNFERIRDYMRAFYVYGFKSRSEYDAKSARSYDNERRRMESWLGGYMSFHQDAAGKRVFLSVDSRRIPHNPLYKALKAKSFTDRDITLHFYILDLLADGSALSSKEIVDHINGDYLSHFRAPFSPDESTVRKKLKEYEALGLLQSEKKGREVFYRRTDQEKPDLNSWADALAYFSEEAPLGVVGSFLLDKLQQQPSDILRFKHHYILHALDSDILYRLLQAVDERRAVELTLKSLRSGPDYRRTVCPLKLYISTQSGRQYLLGYHYRGKRMTFFRLDAIRKVAAGNVEKRYEQYMDRLEKFDQHLWGVSTGPDHNLDHIEMTVRVDPGEAFIRQRLEREKRHGTVETVDDHTCRFTADVYDAAEMLPWLRTFIGRIVDLKCSNPSVADTFREDLNRMNAMYGGDDVAVQ
ncbi:MAG: WYL domain-containing protein [Oscillospiraceae bacterium]|nr:WYL domain-containing protein [Oscillospiraceae bacterium]